MPELITSRKNSRIKAAVDLRKTRNRRESSQILIDGHRELLRALDAGVKIEYVFSCSDPFHIPEKERAFLFDRIHRANAGHADVVPDVFEKLCYGDRNDGVVAVAGRPTLGFNDLRLPADALIAVVEQIEKPGNLGAILRTADAAGVAAVLVADPGTDIYGPNVIRASLGAVFCVPTVSVTAAEIKNSLAQDKVQFIAARPDATHIYTDIDYTGPTAIVFGSEAQGLSAAWSDASVTAVNVPMRGRVDSLNVSTTAAIFFYEALRQRMRKSR